MSFTWNAFGWLNLGIDAAVVAVGCLFAWRAWPHLKPTPLRPVLAGALGLLAALIAFAPLVPIIGGILGFSLGARVAWTTCTVTAPVLALSWGLRQRRAWPVLAALSLVLFKYHGEVREPNTLDVQRASIPIKGLKAPVRLVHLSDLQTDQIGPLQARVQRAANDFEPDLVVFTGDVVNHASLAAPAAAYLKGFEAEGKYFVSGDVDGVLDLPRFLAAAGFTFLDGRTITQTVRGARLALSGVAVGDAWDRGLLTQLARQTHGADARLLLSHRPDVLFAARDLGFDVLFAGHTHGGQVCLPWFGPIVTLSRVARSIAAGGVHALVSTTIVVSRGLGWEGHIAPRVRLFCRPHLLLLELVPSELPPIAGKAG